MSKPSTIVKVASSAMALLAVGWIGWQAASARPAEQVETTTLREHHLRRNATRKPKPDYPEESLKAGVSGLVVAEILIDTAGRVERVRVLEAPDTFMSAAVERALRTWEFTPLTTGPNSLERKKADGKLFFYFEIQDGKGSVLFPDEVAARRGQPVPEQSGGMVAGAPATPPSVQSPPPADALREVGEAELQTLIRTGRHVVVDVRDRSAFRIAHRDGSINIPADELRVRASELAGVDLVALDCTYVERSRCHLFAQVLASLRVPRLVVLVGK